MIIHNITNIRNENYSVNIVIIFLRLCVLSLRIFLLIAVVLNLKTFRISLNNPLRIIGFIIFNLLNVLSFYLIGYSTCLVRIIIFINFLFRLSLKIDIKHLHIVYKLFNLHLYYAFFLYFLTLVFGIEISQLFEFGFYGEEVLNQALVFAILCWFNRLTKIVWIIQ